jgi:sulfide:quinone oxidoreductase
MADIVILGAGIGGMPMAFEMRENTRPENRMTVISSTRTFHVVPSTTPGVAVN